jgi:hypothetical protein
MCTHQHTKNYHPPLPDTCQATTYIAQRSGQFGDLPTDSTGKCVFHSQDLEWKRAQNCGERFLDLFRAMASDEDLDMLDFREFWLTGSDFSQKEGILLENSFADDIVILMGGTKVDKPIRLRGARFCDGLLLSDLSCVDIDFDEAVFTNVATLQRCHFRDFTSFIGNCRFEHNLIIEDCVFEQLVSMDNALFMEQLFVVESDFKEGLSCWNAHQLTRDIICQFSDVRFGAYTSFMDASFNAPLVFERCVFAGETRFENTVLRERFQLIKPSIQEKMYFSANKPGLKIFENALDITLEDDAFGTFGQIIFQNANLYNANPDFKEAIRTLELNHNIDIREGCLLYRNAIERVFPYSSTLIQALVEDLSKAFARFLEAQYVRSLKVDMIRDIKQQNIRVIFHSDEAMSIQELEALLNTGKLDMLSFLSQPPNWAHTQEVERDIWLQLKAILDRIRIGGQGKILQDFFKNNDNIIPENLQNQLNLTLNLTADNILIGNTIQTGGDMHIGDVINHGLSVEASRSIAIEEVFNNLRNLDTRLHLIAHALQLSQDEAFTLRFDELMRQSAPGISPDPANNLRNLLIRTDIAGLRHALNAHLLGSNFGKALAEVFIKTNLGAESVVITRYLDQFEEIRWAEESLFGALESLANAKTPQDIEDQRVLLGWATVFNRAMIYHLYALRLLNALETTPDALVALDGLRVLSPKKSLSEEECNTLLMGRLTEMATLMQERAQLVSSSEENRDKELEDGFAAIMQQTTVYPSDTWQEIIIKVRVLRNLGRIEEAIAALQQYGDRFADIGAGAKDYAAIAILFINHLPQLDVNGGLYISAFDPESLMLQQGVCIGDILLSMQGQPMYGMDDYLSILMKTPPNTPIEVSIIRWQPTTSHFQNLSITIPRKPLGVHFLPI